MAQLKKIQLFQRFWAKNIMQAEHFPENSGNREEQTGFTGFPSLKNSGLKSFRKRELPMNSPAHIPYRPAG